MMMGTTGISCRSLQVGEHFEMVPTSSHSLGAVPGPLSHTNNNNNIMGFSDSIDFDFENQKWFEESVSLRTNPRSSGSDPSHGSELEEDDEEDEVEGHSGHLMFKSPVQYRKSLKYGGPAAERRKSSPTCPFRKVSLPEKCQKLKMVF